MAKLKDKPTTKPAPDVKTKSGVAKTTAKHDGVPRKRRQGRSSALSEAKRLKTTLKEIATASPCRP